MDGPERWNVEGGVIGEIWGVVKVQMIVTQDGPKWTL